MAIHPVESTWPFLTGGGQLAGLIASRDWSRTPVGPLGHWPPHMKAATALMLRSVVPIVMLWGDDGVMVYNDAYSVFAGKRHPQLLGSNVREGWDEVADFNDNVMKVGLAGGTLSYSDQELTLHRNGRAEQVWMNLDYSPLLDGDGVPVGVMAIVVETTEKVMAERHLQRESERFEQLFEQAPGFMAMLSGPQHRFVLANPAYRRLTGDRELLGRTVAQALPDAAAQGYVDLLDKVYATGEAFTAHGSRYAMQVHEGGPVQDRYVDFVFQPIRDAADAITGIFVEGVDVTGRMASEAARRETDARLALVIEGAKDHAVLATDALGFVTDWSAGAEAIFGWRAQEIVGRTASTLFTPEDRARRVDVMELETAAREGCATDERWHLRKDGTRVYMNGSVRPLPNDERGRPRGFLKIARDETARKRALAFTDALASLPGRLRDLDDPADITYAALQLLGETLGASRVGFGTIDAVADTLHVERDWTAPRVQSLAGVTPLRDYGSFIDSLKRNEFISIADVREDARTSSAAPALEALDSRAFVNVPVVEQGVLVAVLYVNNTSVRQWSPEELTFVREMAERTRSAAERARGVVALRLSEAQLREANETLEANVRARTRELMAAEEALRQSQKMEAIGQLTGGIAHDFNNLLGGMSTSLQVLERRMAAGKLDNAARYLGMAQDSVKRAAALTHRLLAFSRRQTLDPRAVDANRLIGGMEDLIRRTMGPSVEVEVVGAGGLWAIKVDPSQLENTLLNLCINARDAMAPNGGRLTIETANKWLDQRAASERDLASGQYISICVTDTGAGMSADTIARAFDPFFTTKPMGQGTGLGLSMVYGFVRQSGGQVRVYSELGKGTTMCLYLPRHLGNAEAEPEQPLAEAAEPGDGETVLVIEDEATIRMLIVEELEGAGYRVLSAEDAPGGLRLLQSDARIDLLLTDVGLPGGLNGRQVADAGRVARPQLKVLFITGYAENAAVGNGLLERGMEVITKPFDIAALARKVRDMVER
ncbi:PAS domain S-box protein [Variovorax sp. dw_954]|uniref:PAS domain-containing hybrid sensor histidine kinase/response regulator n=1 Tax=Variovorax sp. dw_954 TaxID=2720078 RepID=UPI002115FBC1|nr:PAS domain S-box protein [Variovorax sp. dw_954]